MGRWERSKRLISASWAVLRQDKELMVLPLVSGLVTIGVAATFLVPTALTMDWSQDEVTTGPLQWVLVGLMYLALAYVAIFFQTALLCGADERMRGGNPSVSSALQGASQHAGRILPWAIVSATVSVVLRAIEDKAGWLGRIVVGLVGMAWAVVTFLVLPILVFEGLGVKDAVTRSASLFKQTWGENLIVQGGIGLLTFLLTLAVVVVGGGLTFAAANLAAPLGIVVGVVTALALIAVICWSTAMSSVVRLALYRYATDGAAPAAFATADLPSMFAPKSQRGAFGR